MRTTEEIIKEQIKETNWLIEKNNLSRLETLWVISEKKINLLNYLYYRYFTDSFERFLAGYIRSIR